MSVDVVTAFPARRSVPQSPPSWADSRKLVWDTVGELRRRTRSRRMPHRAATCRADGS